MRKTTLPDGGYRQAADAGLVQDLTEAVNETFNHDCADKRFVLAQTQKVIDEGWTLSSMRMNIHGEVMVNLWRPLQDGEEPQSHTPLPEL